MDCLLCASESRPYFTGRHGGYYFCPNCEGVFLRPQDHPDEAAERARYAEHNNDVCDTGYQRFVSPIADYVRENHSCRQRGLDFGCGTGPVISYMLEEEGFSIEKFDPLFSPDRSLLAELYDFVVCCEVIEHFHQPAQEFKLLRELLSNGGNLICMTHLLSDETDFETWYYKDDPTHVFFYRERTIDLIRERFGFDRAHVRDRLIVFST